MRKIFISLLALSLLAVASCHKNSTQGSLTLKVNPMFGSSPLVLNQNYQAPDGKFYNFQDYKFFLSHIKLIQSNGNTVEVCPIAYASLDDAATLNIPLTNTPGSYTGIQFNVGLDSTQDAMPTNTSDSSSPLWANHFMTWGNPTLEYVFVFVDGDGDSSSNAQYNFPITYHVGTSPNYTTGPVISKNFTLGQSSNTVLTLNEDLQQVFYNPSNSNAINILVSPTTQTLDSPALAHRFINDFATTFTLN